jgi:molybdate transport system substrate-binding protein
LVGGTGSSSIQVSASEPSKIIRVAVASNFATAARALSDRFEAAHEAQVVLVPGSTGKHYAQIVHGAPFDIFFAADEARPRRLEGQGIGVQGTRFTYAIGRLVLWSPRVRWFDSGTEHLVEGDFHRLSIANPKLAPFGEAARQALEALGLWESMQTRIVRGENVGQAMHFVVSGGAEIGFVSLSQVTRASRETRPGSHWIVPQRLYEPIRQQAILLVDTPLTQKFARFVQSPRGKEIIEWHGYGIP